jgi:hypothetical protein
LKLKLTNYEAMQSYTGYGRKLAPYESQSHFTPGRKVSVVHWTVCGSALDVVWTSWPTGKIARFIHTKIILRRIPSGSLFKYIFSS